jgi:hypothetical protein
LENAKNEGEGEGEEEEQVILCGGDVWLAVETAEASGERELLFTDGQRSFFSSVFALLLVFVLRAFVHSL